jgi:hypothetical protein
MSNLVDVWFTLDQLKTIKHCLDNYYHERSNDFMSDIQLELEPILEHLDHLIKHYQTNETRSSE